MKLIIDILEETVNEIKDNAMFAGTIPSEILWDVTSAIVNGTPLDKIRAEITENLANAEKESRYTQDDIDCGICVGLKRALDIIDKYKKEVNHETDN